MKSAVYPSYTETKLSTWQRQVIFPSCPRDTHIAGQFTSERTKSMRQLRWRRSSGSLRFQIVFVLEPHYRNESVSNPPFMVSRTGWGEFAVKIRIYFHDSLATKPLVLSHDLRLVAYHTPEQSGHHSADDWSYVPFVREEKYDEIVVFRPLPQQKALFDGTDGQVSKASASASALQEGPRGDCKSNHHEVSRTKALKTILHAKKVINARLGDVRARLIANRGCTTYRPLLQPIGFAPLKGGDTPKKRAGRPKKGIERIYEFVENKSDRDHSSDGFISEHKFASESKEQTQPLNDRNLLNGAV
ncbi:uncharacterized protein LOC111267925 isoform X2 [Varroa jacobsoni]|uniref:uncharacterized protein LOC111267925 isoform X2 n=1 Tax=Varroa jacobsoni TaxID=62625 RepID=UPI000BF5F2EE|nr:uncharacterized protein LOC111267925 isoform X2 [Varroa jacobsoni]